MIKFGASKNVELTSIGKFLTEILSVSADILDDRYENKI